MFAEFELKIHEFVEQDVPLTPALLKQFYRELNGKYFGEHMCIDDEIDIEWARIPHFYYNFYVYQYATGLSASSNLAQRVLGCETGAKDQYLRFLGSGSSKFPLETLADAGVDMRSSKPVEALIGKFNALVDQLEALLAKK
jgi:oligoendopeptidase F